MMTMMTTVMKSALLLYLTAVQGVVAGANAGLAATGAAASFVVGREMG